jgi:hypothetical protein
MTEEIDYLKYRGKCRAFSEELCRNDSTLRLVRGHYICPVWGEQAHWWCERPDGTIVDPTKDQFPSKGIGQYFEFNGMIACEYCGEEKQEEDAYIAGHHVYCSYTCYGRDVM